MLNQLSMSKPVFVPYKQVYEQCGHSEIKKRKTQRHYGTFYDKNLLVSPTYNLLSYDSQINFGKHFKRHMLRSLQKLFSLSLTFSALYS